MSRERIDLRIEPDILDDLESIAKINGVDGRSAAIREAIYFYIEHMKNNWNSDSLSVSIPKRMMDQLDLFIRNGDATDVDQAIVLALTDWCAKKEKYYLSGRSRLENIMKDNRLSDLAKRDMSARAKKLAER